MPENTTAPSDLASQYAAQVTTDLERNTEEQKRISAEIDALQEQLAVLQRDHAVLVTMQRALGLAPAPAETEPASDAATVPAPRKKASTSASASASASTKTKRTRGKKTTAAPAGAKAAKQATRKAPATGRKPDQPTLVDLVRGHLTDVSEPRSAAEVATALGQSHPERNVKTAVVRTTLEGLVAKGQAQRSKQGSSVYYTAADPSAPEPQQPAVTEQPDQSA
ncbi:hypothetical protein [Streptomyces sp.]|uniref:hypothetical protein n=1 Tax=Streptomyces sp. TaxID=1931 RepID=UPI002D51C5F7|nr:hypothetical protein [Streptomyces sp.]HZF91601.1 hypothetical protein [Streptomyces sp.]